MEQPSDPSAPHQVIYIVQAAKEKVNIKEADVKAATVVGVFHIICGIIALGADIKGLSSSFYVGGLGIGASVLFFVSGGLAIGGARSGNKCLLVATMVTGIISLLAAGFLLIVSLLWWALICFDQMPDGSCWRARDTYWWLVAVGAIMLVLAIAPASLTCCPLCCPSTNKTTLSHHNNQAPPTGLVNPAYQI